MKKPVGRLFLTGSLALALSFGAVQSAFAHAHPKHETPAPNATIDISTKEVAIDFDEGLEPSFSSIIVTGADGKPVNDGKSAVAQNDDKHMTAALQPLSAGTYTVAWIAVAKDGHRTQGHYTFTVK
ncbi:MAG TPA: copper homeostasis periplasmic binding protein CopC [Paraburkholderia sp.]|uniref:copper homeostasis periplasmic binding protein CopC n=1 Tax=Paraburkholderia sp. TaxID=1926495 RepID=UPI002CCEA9D4|nr:copper homeostasis periplasmic binding protein CopC [Paraburkholderia sp.]HTR08589.1 copper homeostasis periplasmic binding protein CopC [Paraburkholderia sp.]